MLFSTKRKLFLGGLSALFGATGLFASVSLLLARIARFENPEFVPSCTLNVWYDCSRVMDSRWSELTGYPNYINGIILYSLAVMTGLFIMANKENDRRVIWFSLLLSGAGLFVNVNLLYVSAFLINAICLWCVLSIVSTAGVFFSILEYAGRAGFLGEGERIRKYLKWVHVPLLFGLYLLVFGAVFGVQQMGEVWPEFFEITWPNPFFWV